MLGAGAGEEFRSIEEVRGSAGPAAGGGVARQQVGGGWGGAVRGRRRMELPGAGRKPSVVVTRRWLARKEKRSSR
jgi:hypothetical protein